MNSLNMSAEDAVELLKLFERHHITVWVDGGWGVDALLGEQTRLHNDLDLALADNGTMGAHQLFRNRLPAALRQRGLNVLVLDARGRYTRAGAEVRVYRAGTRTLLGTRMVDTGSGYCSQNMMPVHVGLPTGDAVDVEVTTFSPGGRKVTSSRGVDPRALNGKALIVKAG